MAGWDINEHGYKNYFERANAWNKFKFPPAPCDRLAWGINMLSKFILQPGLRSIRE